jgi:beta-phosphoglucomutase-like phosphatase (HAD superfamily)
MKHYWGIIFDFNGVLWWDNALQERAWCDFSAGLRGYPLDEVEMAEHVHGRNNRYTLQYLSGRPLSAQEIEAFSDQKEDTYRRLCLELGEGFRLSPGAESLLDFLVAGGIPRTIATASGKDNVDFFTRHLRLERWFELSRIVYDDGTLAGKPAPDFYLRAADRLDLPPERCIVVEDSLSGLLAARAAGIGRVFALLGDGSHALRGEIPENVTVIRDLDELNRNLFARRRGRAAAERSI